MQDIPQYNSFAKILPVDKGWSQDKKYRIETAEGHKLLLRLTPASAYLRKQEQYTHLCQMAELNLNMSRPVDFGLCSNGSQVYTLLTWVDGEDALDVLPTLPRDQQFALGLEAGAMLRKIHSIPAPPGIEPWEQRYNRKIDRNIASYKNCGYKLPEEERILAFVHKTRHLLASREQTVQHGDFHAGNMVITPFGEIALIDFNRSDWGDPWEEFNRIVFSVSASPDFAAGNIKGYFQGDPPQKFFQLMALYIAANFLAALPWAMEYGEQEVNTALQNTREMLAYYQDFATVIPTWYKEHVSAWHT